jgi:hypothetical protein
LYSAVKESNSDIDPSPNNESSELLTTTTLPCALWAKAISSEEITNARTNTKIPRLKSFIKPPKKEIIKID